MKHCVRFHCIAIILGILCLLCCACAKEQEDTVLNVGMEQGASSSAPSQENTGQSGQTREQSSTAASGVQVKVLQSVAYAFDGMLYGAVEYQNSGSENLILGEATFTFSHPGGEATEQFLPVANEYDVVRPGETSYCTLFLPVEGITGGEAVSLTPSLTCQPAQLEPFPLEAEHPYLVQNYPAFCTLSGSLKNPDQGSGACELNMIDAGFYDEEGNLLGVWYFSRNAVLDPGVSKPFVVHLKALPIPALADHCKEIRLRAFGI